MSLYRTLSQLPNDLPLILGKKVDANAAKTQGDPLDAWFTPIVSDWAPLIKNYVESRPCPKLTARKHAVAESKQNDADEAREQVRKMTIEAFAILGRPAMLMILDGYCAKRLIDLELWQFESFIQTLRMHILNRIEIDSAKNQPLPYNRPALV